jgi:hypothetical protein
MGAWTFAKGDAEFLGGAAAIDGEGGPCYGATTGQHLTGLGIGGPTLVINGVAVVLGDQLAGIGIDFDQEITNGIKGDEPLGKTLVELESGRVIAHSRGTAIPRRIAGHER